MRFFICFYILVSSTICFAQEGGTISGKVMSMGEPISGTPIKLRNKNYQAGTDENGEFKLEGIPAGEYTIEVKTFIYENFSTKVKVEEGKITFISIKLQEAVTTTDEVVVTGTMKETGKLKSPIAVEVYTPQFFKKQPSASIFEALSMVNGVQPQLNCSVCNTGDIHINGMEGPYTMILIDGMPIVSSLSTVYGLSGIPNSLIKRIEVVKGPAATLYGSEAVGGLINIITKDPSSAPKLQLDVMGTSYEELNVDVSGKAAVKKTSVLFGVNYFNFNKRWDVNTDNFTDVTLQNRISLFTKWKFARKKERQAGLAVRYIYEDRFGGELGWSEKWRGTDSIYGESIYTKRWELIGTYQLPINNEKITLQYSYNHHQQNSFYGVVPYFAAQQTAFAQLLWDKKLGARHDLLVGLPMRYIFYDDNTIATQDTVGGSIVTKPSVTVLPGIFIQDEFSLTEKITTLAGIRYDHHNIHGTILSPRISFKYSPNRNNTFRLTGGNGFRVVNLFTEDHAALTGSRTVEIKSKLSPEESWNANLNYVKFFNHKRGYVGLDGSLFYTYFTNKIVGDFLTDPSKIIYDNLKGYAISKGATLNLDFSFKSGLKIITGVTLMDVYQIEKSTGVEKKVPQLFAPKFSGTYQLSYTFSKLKLSLDYTGRVNGPMFLPVVVADFRASQSPWFDIANFQITKKVRKVEFYGGLKNLWNFLPKDPILRPFDPFDKAVSVNNPNGYTFDTTYNYASMQRRRLYIGFRYAF